MSASGNFYLINARIMPQEAGMCQSWQINLSLEPSSDLSVSVSLASCAGKRQANAALGAELDVMSAISELKECRQVLSMLYTDELFMTIFVS